MEEDFNFWLHKYLSQIPLQQDVLLKMAEDINRRHKEDIDEVIANSPL